MQRKSSRDIIMKNSHDLMMRRVGNLGTIASEGWCEPCGEQFLKRTSEMEHLLPVKTVINKSGEKSQLEWYHGEVVSNRDGFRLFLL